MKKEQGHIIKEVHPDSIAEELEIAPGDVLLAINDKEIDDDQIIDLLVSKFVKSIIFDNF